MPRKLKVFRTAAGFNDAYVAAPSRKAALAAWGADVDLFARGIAEEVTAPELGEEPLANPGEVIMRSRGGLAEQLKAMGPSKRAAGKARKSARHAKEHPEKPRGKPPSRAKVEKAAAALAEARDKHMSALKGLEDKRDALDRQIAALKDKQRREIESLQQRRREAEQAYRDALDAWSG